MKKLYLISLCIMALFFAACSQDVSIEKARVEMRENPVGLDVLQPRFMWQLNSSLPDVKQTAYRIIVADSPEKLNSQQDLLWDSGDVQSDNTVFIAYEGPALESRKTYYWKVKSTTNKGETDWSDVNQWSMALLSPSDWNATWIGMDSSLNATDCLTSKTRLAARYLRKEFPAKDAVKKATLYITGLGFYEGYINGKKIGNDVFAPTATDYSKTVNYNVFDVTDMLDKGQNTVGVILGNGRFFTMRMPDPTLGIPGVRNFGFPKMLMQLEVEYANGEKETIVSDESWKLTTNGPIVANNEFDGEEYNANLELNGWAENGFDESAWLSVQKVAAPEGKLTAQHNPNIATMEEITPVSITETGNGSYILDMGQNMVGWLAVKLNGKKDQPVTMVFAETLKPDGSLYMDNLRGANVTDIYTPAADGEFSWEPRFTYHGFRFVEIKGLDSKPELSSFTGKVNYDKMDEVGTFVSSNPTINQIFKNAYWGIRGNYRSMPTDCPQRDERMGWLGDRATGCFGESFIFDQALLYEKWIQDIEDAQAENGCVPDVAPNYWAIYSDNITWPAAYLCAVNMLYEQYGDTEPIRKHYDSMKRWIKRMTSDEFLKDYIFTRDVYGDWCMPPEKQELIHSADPARKTDGSLLATSFLYRMLQLMSKYALISGNEADSPEYLALAGKIKDAYNAKYFNAEENYYSNNTVTANIISLMQGLAPAGTEEAIFKHVVDKTEKDFNGHVSTGLIGIQYLMRGLTAYGKGDLAYQIATNETYPSWGYMIKKGATTIWELWNGDTADPAMNSANHVMLLGDLMIWYYENLAGIKTDKNDVGFKKIEMAPYFPDGLDNVKASYNSVQGEIKSEWNKNAESINWKITVPCNTTATVKLPAASVDQITESGKALSDNQYITVEGSNNGVTILTVGSGDYNFLVKK